MESLMRPNLLLVRMPSQDKNQRNNRLKRFNQEFPVLKKTKLMLTPRKKTISIKCVFKEKTHDEGKFCRYKARLVCKEKALISLKLLHPVASFIPSDF